jgi:hypothetical protein
MGNDPRYRLPPGRLLTRDLERELVALWAANDFATLTDEQIESVMGAPLPTPSIRREFGTGRWPVDFNKQFG